ncbi:hypothetical protein A4G20_07055 [Pasteurellaceae bacterium RH1A]|nr:hypothetical protein A4G20_07055 [Pasteurellaceae bacterium RH1A]
MTKQTDPKPAKQKLQLSRFCKPLVKGLASLGLTGLLAIFALDYSVSYLVKDKIYTDIEQLPHRPYAVVLGTAKYYPSRAPNLYYKYRIDAAIALYKARKVDDFLVSGDNATPYYNEPRVMTNDLRRKGIPNVLIKQDYAGYDTLASIIRAHKTYEIPAFTIVSQQFHCERALMIAKFNQIDAICYAAQYPEGHYRVRIREVFARVGMYVDYLMGKQPKTLDLVKEQVVTK